MITHLANLFEPVTPAERYRRWHWITLWLVLAAGAAVRFWNLGMVGLHGDEDIMGLAARGVLEHGIPVLPSGMVYARAPLHTYLIASSMSVFGDNEWTIRFPSAVVGSFVGLLGFWMGRRFLEPVPNLAFAALLTFLPGIVEYSQTGRMYIFFVASLLLFGALLFRWERTERFSSLAFVFLAWMVALQFHTLAVFATPLFLFPGLARRSSRLLVQGAAATIGALSSYKIVETLVTRYYPSESDRLRIALDSAKHPIEILFGGNALLLGVTIAIGVAVVGTVALVRRTPASSASFLFAVGVAAAAMLHHHIGAIAVLFGAVVWYRTKAGSRWVPVGVVATVVTIAFVQAVMLHGTGDFAARKIVSALVGRPGFWPTVRFASFSPAGTLVYSGALALALVRVARSRLVPEHFAFFTLAVWTPIFAIGLFRWDPAPRYTSGLLPFFLLCVIAGAVYLCDATRSVRSVVARPAILGLLWTVLVVAFVNPVEMLRVARNDYSAHPDHKGAAEFVRNLHPPPNAILIAEDSINQTYYLGRVDYRLLYEMEAAAHSVLVNGVLRGQYTGTPVLGSGAALERVLDAAGDRDVYILGSGENFADGRRGMRGGGIYEVLESDRLEVIYEGRDGRTKVWRLER